MWLEKNDDTSASSISLSNPTKSSPSVAVLSAPSIEIIGEVKAPVRAAPVASVAVPAPQKPLNPWVLHLIKEVSTFSC